MCIYALFTFPSCSHPAFVAHSYCPELQEPSGPHETRPSLSPYAIQMLFADDKTLLERNDLLRSLSELEPSFFSPNSPPSTATSAKDRIGGSLVDLSRAPKSTVELHGGARSMVDLSATAGKGYDPIESQQIYDVALAVAEANARNRARESPPPQLPPTFKKRNRETRIIDGDEYAPATEPCVLLRQSTRQAAQIPEVIYEEDEDEESLLLNEAFEGGMVEVSEIQRLAEERNEVPEPLRTLHVKSVQYHIIYPSCKKIEMYNVNGWPFLETACGSCSKKAWRSERAKRLIRKKSSEMLKEISGKLNVVGKRKSDNDLENERKHKKMRRRSKSVGEENGGAQKQVWKKWLRWRAK